MEMTLEAVRKNLEYLEHYGVKGQRWGIRRTPEQLGHILKKKNARHYGKYNAAVKRISEIQGDKSISQLSPKDKKKIAKAIEKAQDAVGKIQSTEKKFTPKIEKAEARQAKQEEKSAEKEAKATAKKEAAQAKAEEKAQKEQAKNEKLKAKLMKDPNWDEVYANRNLFSNQELNDITTRMNSEKKMRDALEENSTFNRMANKMKTAANVAGAGLDLYNKAQDIKGIFDAGKKNKAYAEIRQLMADGKYADVVKKSTVISDKDIENFSKRKTLLDNLRKDSGYTTTNNGTSDTKDTKDSKDTKDKKQSDFIEGLSDIKYKKPGPSSSLKSPVNTMTIKVGKGRKGQTLDFTTFNYDDYTQSMMEKVASKKANERKTEPTGTKLPVSADASNIAGSWYSGKGTDTTWAGITETQRKLNVVGNATPLSNKGLIAEKYRVDRVNESKLTNSQKRRVNDITEAAHSIVLNNMVDVTNRIVEDNSKKTLKDVKPKITKERVSGVIENATSGSIFNQKGSDVLSSYSGIFDNVKKDYDYKKRMDKSYDILNSISKKEADDLKYFIPGTAYAYANDGSLDGFPFTSISASSANDASRIAENKPWKDYELKHFMKFINTLEHSQMNNKKEAKKIIDKYEILILNGIGDFKLSDFKK